MKNKNSTRDEPHLIEIDKDRLDWEWVNHVKEYHAAALVLEEARKDHEEAKALLAITEQDLEEVKARLDLKIRRDPESFDLDDKPREEAIKNTILLDASYKKVLAEVHRADGVARDRKSKVGFAEVLVKVMDHKKPALENLTKLRLADYFSTPIKPKELKETDADKAFGKHK